ncbi:MAG TPA: response regulator [Polyangiaceae bacterium]|jgi:CheY-like chemotaxis protein
MARRLKNILYVEDEPDIQVVGKLALESVGGFTVRVCDRGAQALALARQDPPDLILLDVMMPELDGPSTLRALRQEPALAATPVIFLTARVAADEVMGYRALGAIGVIAKPFDPMQLAANVTRIWNEQHG